MPIATLRDLVARALAEDLGAGDITSEAVVPADARADARIVQKQPGVVFGLEAAAEAFAQAGAAGFEALEPEGEWRDSVPTDVALASGPARALLAAERTALNLLCHLSGVATLTARFVDAVAGTGAAILDTRKTTPGLRALEKAAVAAGGGRNHRMGLHDAVLIKENHVALAGGLAEAVRRAREAEPEREIEVECRSADEVEAGARRRRRPAAARQHGPGGVRAAVAARDAAAKSHGPVATLEASGGITLDNVAEIAATGVDFISVGALTHSAPALDLSMLLEPADRDELDPEHLGGVRLRSRARGRARDGRAGPGRRPLRPARRRAPRGARSGRRGAGHGPLAPGPTSACAGRCGPSAPAWRWRPPTRSPGGSGWSATPTLRCGGAGR